MISVLSVPAVRVAMRVASASLMLAMLAGCSSESSRFSSPFSNPFASSTDNSPTGSIAHTAKLQKVPLAYDKSITSRPLAAPSAQAARYVAPIQHASALPRAAGASGHWSADGGTPIVVATGESAAILATRYGVPETDLLRVNGMTSAAQIQPGARLVVPIYNGRAAAASQAAPHGEAPRKIAADETPSRKASKVAALSPRTRKPGAGRVALPLAGTRPDRAPRSMEEQKAALKGHHKRDGQKAALADKTTKLARRAPTKLAEQPPLQQPKIARQLVSETPAPQAAPVVDKVTNTASLPSSSAIATDKFRWPAHGRIIGGFKPGVNDGINIAVPDGTSVKAAEGGVVAYAGNELKGYGNLVLIRHPNGFVSAYANNGKIDVKRGQTVTRGQTIAVSGQSGNVDTPQLHFELRKGSTPVDPTHFLAGL